ncbi:hypothetical protein, partial [Enterovibrio nigricans]
IVASRFSSIDLSNKALFFLYYRSNFTGTFWVSKNLQEKGNTLFMRENLVLVKSIIDEKICEFTR